MARVRGLLRIGKFHAQAMEEFGVGFPHRVGAHVERFLRVASSGTFTPTIGEVLDDVNLPLASGAPPMQYKLMVGGKAHLLDARRRQSTFAAQR
jgi:hypothetical protein